MTDCNMTEDCTRLAAKPAGGGFSLLGLLALWYRRARERQQLAAMKDLAWGDLGLSDIDVKREIKKPFWRP